MVLGRLADPLRGATEHDVAQEVSITAEELRKREGGQGWEFVVPALLPPGRSASGRRTPRFADRTGSRSRISGPSPTPTTARSG